MTVAPPRQPAASAAPMIIVLMGVSGCGKTTTGEGLSKLLGWPFRDADSFHPPANVEKMRAGTALTDDDRWPWLAAIAAWMDQEVDAARSGIVSCSALKRVYRERLLTGRPAVRVVHLVAPQALIARRLARRRAHFMPASLLQSQFDTLEPPEPGEGALLVPVRQSPRRPAAA